MFYLILSILCGASMSLLFKYSQMKKWSGETITLVNYIVCVAICLPMAIQQGLLTDLSLYSLSDMWESLPACLAGSPNAAGSFLISLILGFFLGIMYLINFLHQQYCIRISGASMTSMFSHMAFVVPLVLSIFLWNEIPQVYQWLGIGGTLLAIAVASRNGGKFQFNFALVRQMLMGSVTSLILKVYAMYALVQYKQLFYLITFGMSLLLYLIYVVCSHIKRRTPFDFRIQPILGGTFLGVANTVSGFFSQNALRQLPANIFYPTSSAGGLILVTLICTIFLKEKLTRNQLAAILISVVSVAVVNLQL